MCAHLDLIIGPMFAGKTTELMRRLRRLQIGRRRVCAFKYAADTRYTEASELATHDGERLTARMFTSSLFDVLGDVRDMDVIGVDEAQFAPDIVEFCQHVLSLGISVIVAALDGTFNQRAFGRVLDLVPLADSVVKLTAVCHTCGADAPFTRRIGADTRTEVIGGSEAYAACCRACLTRYK